MLLQKLTLPTITNLTRAAVLTNTIGNVFGRNMMTKIPTFRIAYTAIPNVPVITRLWASVGSIMWLVVGPMKNFTIKSWKVKVRTRQTKTLS